LAGIVLSEAKEFFELESKFRPVGDFLIPFFFVVMGTKFDVPALLEPRNLTILTFTVVLAVVGKGLGSALGTWNLGAKAALQTAIGMVPRGEVGIVVGTLGLTLGVINKNLFGVVLGMSIVTTLIVPPLLGWAFKGEFQASDVGTDEAGIF
ncbi:MAG: cation:proton antiporter, partial [Actinomycetota bacterium]|nr:cation:proton antiporter [Actinomycetota bacterium]